MSFIFKKKKKKEKRTVPRIKVMLKKKKFASAIVHEFSGRSLDDSYPAEANLSIWIGGRNKMKE
jgi:hypothetical protein